jgi:7-carboxy-7-deazaguanine synthase
VSGNDPVVHANIRRGIMPRIYSIFQSVEGEVNARGIGAMTVFIRFAGCHATCTFCDTTYAKDPASGRVMSVSEVMEEVSKYNCPNVTITGGEPMEQYDELCNLLHALDANQYNVSVETNGLHSFWRRNAPMIHATFVVDIKNEGFMALSRIVNMGLTSSDILKMVVGSEADFAVACTRKRELQERGVKARFAFSPEFGKVDPDRILSWMKKYDQNDAILNFQAHKVLNLTENN